MDLDTWLKKHDITRTEFAQELGISRMTVFNWCTGKRPSPLGAQTIEWYTKGDIKAKDLLDRTKRIKNA